MGSGPIVVYSAHPTQEGIDIALLYKNTKGQPRAVLLQTKHSVLGAKSAHSLDAVLEKGEKYIQLSKPLREFGIVHKSQITLCICVLGKMWAMSKLGSKSTERGVEFHVVVLDPKKSLDFFGPSLASLPFFNDSYKGPIEKPITK
jgi:hypothetical protein